MDAFSCGILCERNTKETPLAIKAKEITFPLIINCCRKVQRSNNTKFVQ